MKLLWQALAIQSYILKMLIIYHKYNSGHCEKDASQVKKFVLSDLGQRVD